METIWLKIHSAGRMVKYITNWGQQMNNKVYKLSDSYSLFKGEFNENKYYLFNIEDGTIYRLNEVSYDILVLFDGTRDIETIEEIFINQYQGEHDRMKTDFGNLLKTWINKEILISGGENNG